MLDSSIITNFQNEDECSINIELVKKLWDENSVIYVLNENIPIYKLIQWEEKDSLYQIINISISKETVFELIFSLKLKEFPDPLFKNMIRYHL